MNESFQAGDDCTGKNICFFEGVEKLLEIWLSRSTNSIGSGDARDITRFGFAKVNNFDLYIV